MLSVDPVGRRLEWAYAYAPKADPPEYYYGYAVRPPPTGPANLLLDGPVLFLKEFGATAMYGLDLSDVATAGPALRCRRPVDADAGLLAVHGTDLLMLGATADAIDTGTLQMRWSNALPMGTAARPGRCWPGGACTSTPAGASRAWSWPTGRTPPAASSAGPTTTPTAARCSASTPGPAARRCC